MAFHPGESHTIRIDASNAGSDGIIDNLAVVSSDPSIASIAIRQVGDPFRFILTCNAVGHVDLTATATNSNGDALSATQGVDVELVANPVTGLTFVYED